MNANIKLSRSIWSSVWVYFAVAFGLTWIVEILWSLSGISLESASGQALLCLAASGPALAAIGLTYLTQDEMGRRDYWLRIIDLRRISADGTWLSFSLLPRSIASLHSWILFQVEAEGHWEGQWDNLPLFQPS